MARQYKTGLIITGDASGGIKAVRATEKELGQLNKGFDRGSKRAKAFAQNTGGVSREMQVLRRMAAPVGAALAGMFAANSLRSQVNFADQLQKTNLRIGASTEALSEYAHVASLADVQFNQLTTAWQRQSRRIAQAARDTGEARDALAALNLDAAELAQLAPEDQFERIAEAMNGVANEADRVAYAQKIWDSEGVRLLQIVNQGTDAIRAQREEAERLGLTISQDTAEAMAGFNDEVTRLQAVGTGLSRQILSELVPAMTSGMQATSEWIDEMGGAAQILETTKDVAAALAAVLAGRLAGSLATATARMMATAGAAGALRGALALVGGPIGLLVGGAGLLYAFREELGLVGEQASNTARRLNQLTASMASMSATEVKTNLESARMEMKFLVDQGQNLRGVLKGMGPGDVWDGRTYSELREQYKRVRDDAIAARDTVKELEGALSDAAETVKVNVPPLEDLDDALDGAATASASAAAESDTFSGELGSLRKQLDPAFAASQRLAESTALLDRGLATGALTLSEYLDLWDKAAETFIGAEEKTRDLGDTNADTAQEMSREWERFGNSVDDTFADAFRGAFESFDDFADQLKGAFENLLAELAYAAVKNEIKIQLGMQGSGPMSGGVGDLLGGGGSSGGGLLSAGRNLLSGNGGRIAWTGASNTAYGGTGFANSATSGVGQSGFMGGSTANFSGMTGLSSMGAGMAGGYAGTELGSSVTGKTANSSYGATAGGMIGTYFGGPVGAFIGSALGGFIDSFFGSEKAPPEFEYEQRDFAPEEYEFGGRDTPFSSTGTFGFDISRLNDESQQALDQFATALQAADNALAGFMDDGQVGRVKEAMDEFAYEGLSSADLLADRLDVILDAAGMQGDLYDRMREDYQGEEMSAKRYEAALNIAQLESTLEQVPDNVISHVESRLTESDVVIGELSESLLIQIQQWEALGGQLEHLVPTFDRMAAGAVDVTNALNDAAGGMENLSALQQGYYQNFFSEAEQQQRLQEQLAQQFEELNMQLPTSRDAFRSIVEGLDLTTREGRETYLSMLELSGSFAQLTQNAASFDPAALQVVSSGALGEIESALDAYNGTASTLQDIAETRQAQLRDEMQAIQTLDDLMRSLTVGAQSALSSSAQLRVARGQFTSLMGRAAGGDTDAVSGLRGASRDYLDLARENAGSALEYARTYGEVTQGVHGLQEEFESSVDELGDIESINRRQLRQQELARSTLIDQLQTQIDMLDGIHTFSGLLETLPAALAGQLEGIIAEPGKYGEVMPDGVYTDDSGFSGVQKSVNSLYQGIFDRNADESGLEYWTGRLAEGTSIDRIRDEMEAQRADGYHADGLGSVPFDGYRAVLHQGETVLPANLAKLYRDNAPGAGAGALVEEVRGLRQQLRKLEAYAYQTTKNTGQAAKQLRRADDGDRLRVVIEETV